MCWREHIKDVRLTKSGLERMAAMSTAWDLLAASSDTVRIRQHRLYLGHWVLCYIKPKHDISVKCVKRDLLSGTTRIIDFAPLSQEHGVLCVKTQFNYLI